MENFNKNWLVILLIVIVFFVLGFLVGRVTGRHHGMRGRNMEKMMMHGDGKRMMRLGREGGDITIKIDTVSKDGQKMEVKVEKKLKK